MSEAQSRPLYCHLKVAAQQKGWRRGALRGTGRGPPQQPPWEMTYIPGALEDSLAARTCEAACTHTPSVPHRPLGAWAGSRAPVS